MRGRSAFLAVLPNKAIIAGWEALLHDQFSDDLRTPDSFSCSMQRNSAFIHMLRHTYISTNARIMLRIVRQLCVNFSTFALEKYFDFVTISVRLFRTFCKVSRYFTFVHIVFHTIHIDRVNPYSLRQICTSSIPYTVFYVIQYSGTPHQK